MRAIRSNGAQAGISLVLDTPLTSIQSLVASHEVDMVQVMSIARIGVQGSRFDDRAYERIRALRAQFPELPIAVDGGVAQDNAALLVAAGATHLGVGSAIVKSPDPAAAYEEICATL